jgi:aspartokinase/homoserine dehydrogenase 1
MGFAMKPQRLTVVKVGGSLLAAKADFLRVASAIAERRRDGESLLVVASALKGVTDLLEQAALRAADRRPLNGDLGHILEALRQRHVEITQDVAGASALERVRKALDEVEALLQSIHASGELSEAAYARILSYGERLSVLLLAPAIEAAGAGAQPVAAEEAGLRAAGPPRAGFCDIPASVPGLQTVRERLRDRILVLTGFYGVDESGGVVLFGRGGTDDTACAVAAGLHADRLELWKDVPGLMSADPQDVRGARVIREISFDEVAQLGAYGSRVVHHGCLDPLRGRPTEIFVSSIPGSGGPSGTRLVETLDRGDTRVVALASRRCEPALIGVVGEGVAGDTDIRSRMLSCLTAAGVRGDLVAEPSGRSGLSCTVHPDDLVPALRGLHDSFFSAPESFPSR